MKDKKRLFSKRKNKKGISAIIATVLIILVTVAGVAIVGVAIQPFIKGLGGTSECFDATSQVTILEDYTCYDASSNNVSVQVSRGSKDFDLVGIQVLISSGGNSNSFKIDENLPTIPGEKVYQIDLTGIVPDQVQIAPIIKIGNSEKTCEISSTIDLRDC